MVKVECGGCGTSYEIGEKRIPPTGLRMRCPKCGTNLVVMKPDVGAPVAASPKPGGSARAAADPALRPPLSTKGFGGADDDLLDLPNPVHQPGAGGGGLTGLGFGEIDMLVDSLAPAGGAGRGTSPFGVPELPDVAPHAEARDMEAVFGDVDLPAVQGETPELPVPVAVPRGAAALRGRVATVQFGEIDLPGPPPPKAPPPPRRLPTAGFGEIDLPVVSEEPGLPVNKPSAMPWPAASGPSSGGFGEIDLPLVQTEGTLPVPVRGPGLPTVASSGLPSAAMHVGMPARAGAHVPSSPPGSSLSGPPPAMMPPGAMASRANPGAGRSTVPSNSMPPESLGGEAFFGVSAPFIAAPSALNDAARMDTITGPPPLRAQPPPAIPEPLDAGEEISLDEPLARGAFDDSDRAVPMQADDPLSASGLDGGIELAETARTIVGNDADMGGLGAGRDGTMAPRRASAPGDTSAEPEKRSGSRKVLIVAAVVLAFGGAALALEPSIGPFGSHFIMDRVNAKKYGRAVADVRADVQSSLDEDTATAATRAVEKAKATHDEMPRDRTAAAYYAYVALMRGLRFGRKSDDDALAKQLLAAVTTGEPNDLATLAVAAQDAENGQASHARDSITALAERLPEDADVAVLEGEIELADKAPPKALSSWKRALNLRPPKKSARALYGLARAQIATNDLTGAEATARAVLEASPQHAGARTLLASLIWQKPDREAEAVALLKKVTEDAAVRGAASDAERVAALTLLGQIHLSKSRISAAEAAFGAAAKLDPQAVDALIGNGEVFYRSSRYAEAQARFEAAVHADPDNVTAKVGLAKSLLALERMKEAKDQLRKLTETHANEPLVFYWLGRVENQLGNKKGAEENYMRAIKVGADKLDVIDAYVSLANLLSGLGRAEEAHQKLVEAGKKFPDQAALHRAKGEVALTTGRFEEAKEEFTEALAKEDAIDTRFKIGTACRRLREFDDAREIFDKVASLDKNYPGLALERGLLFQEMGQSEEALKMYSEALQKAPNDVDLKLRVGSTQVIAGYPAQAEKILREVVKDRTNSAEANHFLGRALLMIGTNLNDAMRHLEAAVNIDSNRAEYFLYLGWGANETGQQRRAEDALNRAIELDQNLADAYWQRGVMLQKGNRSRSALLDLQTAITKRPSRYEAYATMALCYQDQQAWDEAEQAWKNAIHGNAKIPEWHYRLGKLYTDHGKTGSATAELETAVAEGDVAGRPALPWLSDAYLLLGDAARGSNKEKAIKYYMRFREITPANNAYRLEVDKWLVSVGAIRPL